MATKTWIFNNVLEDGIDNMVLQRLLKIIENNLRNEELVNIELQHCSYSQKQRIYIKEFRTRTDDFDVCMRAELPVWMKLIAYQFREDDGTKVYVIAYRDDVEALVGL